MAQIIKIDKNIPLLSMFGFALFWAWRAFFRHLLNLAPANPEDTFFLNNIVSFSGFFVGALATALLAWRKTPLISHAWLRYVLPILLVASTLLFYYLLIVSGDLVSLSLCILAIDIFILPFMVTWLESIYRLSTQSTVATIAFGAIGHAIVATLFTELAILAMIVAIIAHFVTLILSIALFFLQKRRSMDSLIEPESKHNSFLMPKELALNTFLYGLVFGVMTSVTIQIAPQSFMIDKIHYVAMGLVGIIFFFTMSIRSRDTTP